MRPDTYQVGGDTSLRQAHLILYNVVLDIYRIHTFNWHEKTNLKRKLKRAWSGTALATVKTGDCTPVLGSVYASCTLHACSQRQSGIHVRYWCRGHEDQRRCMATSILGVFSNSVGRAVVKSSLSETQSGTVGQVKVDSHFGANRLQSILRSLAPVLRLLQKARYLCPSILYNIKGTTSQTSKGRGWQMETLN